MRAPSADAGPGIGPGPLPFSPCRSLREQPLKDAESVSEARELHFPPRTLIFQEGDAADSIFQVEDGMVMLYQLLPDGRRQVVEFLKPGDVFGLSAAPACDCSAETLVATSCTAYDRSAVEHSAALTKKLGAAAFQQVCGLHEHVMLLGRKSASERMASFIMRLIPSRGRGRCPGPPPQGDDSARVPLPMTRLEIADFLGLTIETVSRVLSRLKRRGILSIQHLDEVDVCDICRLCRLSGTHLIDGKWCSSRASLQNTG